MTRRALALLALGALAGPLAAQRGDAAQVRVTLGDEMRVGRTAPALRLAYVTRDGAGPADQPFDLARELGHVVVLLFRGRLDPVPDAARWESLRADSLFGAGIVIAGVSTASADTLVRLARPLGAGVKLLSDSAGRDMRRLGMNETVTTAIVVGRDGTVQYREERFPLALLPTSRLVAAVRAAKEAM